MVFYPDSTDLVVLASSGLMFVVKDLKPAAFTQKCDNIASIIQQQLQFAVVQTSDVHTDKTLDVAPLGQGAVITAGSGDSVLAVWEWDNDGPVLVDSVCGLTDTDAGIVCVKLASNNKVLFAVDENDQIGMWCVPALLLLNQFKSPAASSCITDFLLLETQGTQKYRDPQKLSTVRFRSLTETNPETRLLRILHKKKFDEALNFASLFQLDTELVYAAHMNHLLDQLSPWNVICHDEEKVSAMVTQLWACLSNVKLESGKTDKVERLHALQTKLLDLQNRLLTYKLMYGADNFSAESWMRFQQANLLHTACYHMMEQQPHIAILLWRRHVESRETLAFRMLDRVVMVELIQPTLKQYIAPYMRAYNLNQDHIFATYIKDLLERTGHIRSYTGRSTWEDKVLAIVSFIQHPKEKCCAVLNVMKHAPLPWSPEIQQLVEDGLKIQHPMVKELQEQKKIAGVRQLLQQYDLKICSVPSQSQAQKVARMIVEKDCETSLEDALRVLKEYNITCSNAKGDIYLRHARILITSDRSEYGIFMSVKDYASDLIRGETFARLTQQFLKEQNLLQSENDHVEEDGSDQPYHRCLPDLVKQLASRALVMCDTGDEGGEDEEMGVSVTGALGHLQPIVAHLRENSHLQLALRFLVHTYTVVRQTLLQQDMGLQVFTWNA
nr:hypothetical protein BaRGS_028743 [Batillaria attramentaria]